LLGCLAPEAMSLGAPAISSDVTSIPEIADDAGILVNPAVEGISSTQC
jgi:glycosyltransferase involved in cell wall biosynthesis